HKPPGIAGAAGVLLARLTAGGAHAISGSRKTEAIKMSTMKEPSAMSATTEKKRPRSAVTSGRKLPIGGDPNSGRAGTYRRDVGGRAMLSEAQLSLVRRGAALGCELEQMEARMSQGEAVNLDSFGRAASHLRRLLEAVGLQRRARDVTPTLAELIAQDEAEQAAEEAAAAKAAAEAIEARQAARRSRRGGT